MVYGVYEKKVLYNPKKNPGAAPDYEISIWTVPLRLVDLGFPSPF